MQIVIGEKLKRYIGSRLEKAILQKCFTIICGYAKLKEIKHAMEVFDTEVSVYLLDANKETIRDRILSRYTTSDSLEELLRTTGKTPEKFIEDNVWVSGKFREEAIQAGHTILDTSDLTPEQVADYVIKIFSFKLSMKVRSL